MGKGRRSAAEMATCKARAWELVGLNPSTSVARVARLAGVSVSTVHRWFEEWKLKRWF